MNERKKKQPAKNRTKKTKRNCFEAKKTTQNFAKRGTKKKQVELIWLRSHYARKIT